MVMKHLNIALTFTIFIYAQNGISQNSDRSIQLQFSTRTQFYAVDNRYNLILDTIYHANPGFRVFSGYDTIKRNGKDYLIFSYPNWSRPDQKKYQKQIEDLLIQIKNIAQTNSEQVPLAKTILNLIQKNFPQGIEINSEVTMAQVKEIRKQVDELSGLLIGLEESERSRGEELIKKIVQELDKHTNPFRAEIKGKNGLKLAMLKTVFNDLKNTGKVEDVYSLKAKYNKTFATGLMTVPFKLRPKKDTVNFNMTTDITLGAYFGYRARISRKGERFIIFPLTLGLSYINVANSETSNVNTDNNSDIVPGWTWSSGIVFDIEGFNIGFVLGQDFASGVGNDWLYNKQLWYLLSKTSDW